MSLKLVEIFTEITDKNDLRCQFPKRKMNSKTHTKKEIMNQKFNENTEVISGYLKFDGVCSLATIAKNREQLQSGLNNWWGY